LRRIINGVIPLDVSLEVSIRQLLELNDAVSPNAFSVFAVVIVFYIPCSECASPFSSLEILAPLVELPFELSAGSCDEVLFLFVEVDGAHANVLLLDITLTYAATLLFCLRCFFGFDAHILS
jgi:hypothetical protein